MKTSKICFKCGAEKSVDDFYRHAAMADGRLGKCKTCTREDVKANRQENRAHYVKFDRLRSRQPDRQVARTAYAKTERGVAVSRKAKADWEHRNPQKKAAATKVHNAIRDGRLERKPCEVCGVKAQAHHFDYSRPLDVIWLCSAHHSAYHVIERRLAELRTA